MRKPRLSKLELQIMDVLWSSGPSSIRDIQERLSGTSRPAYTTIQTMVYRLEAKKVLRRTSKVGNAHLFEALISRDAAQASLVDDFLALFGGRGLPPMVEQHGHLRRLLRSSRSSFSASATSSSLRLPASIRSRLKWLQRHIRTGQWSCRCRSCRRFHL